MHTAVRNFMHRSDCGLQVRNFIYALKIVIKMSFYEVHWHRVSDKIRRGNRDKFGIIFHIFS